MDIWLLFLGALAIILAAAVVVHAATTKEDVRAATGWAALAVLSPFVGALLYAVAGVNRIRRSVVGRRRRWAGPRRQAKHDQITKRLAATAAGSQFVPLKKLGDTLASLPITEGNKVTVLDGGSETFDAMVDAIGGARESVALQTYIFDHDPTGLRLADALAHARARGVEVRVLIDAVGARYSRPSIVGHLRRQKIQTERFMGSFLPLRLPYANLRSHRKVLLVDGRTAFTGGMNIRHAFVDGGTQPTQIDTHFQLEGPIVSQIFRIFAGDWWFVTGERLRGKRWLTKAEPSADGMMCRPIDSGPDEGMERTHGLILGAISVARERIKICSPYFLPDGRLVSALSVAARKGVAVDIVLPGMSNLRFIDWAISAQLDQVIGPGCRVWRTGGAFDHSKLMVIDGMWALIGSSNLDPRSLRLNFELDVEVIDKRFAGEVEALIDRRIASAREEKMADLISTPFLVRLRDRLVWLASPYL